MVIFGICGSIGHNMWSSLVSENWIYQTYRIITFVPEERELDPYGPPWARYHSHGIGVLFGWALLAERRTGIISKFLKSRTKFRRSGLVLFVWAVTLTSLWWTIFGINYCFRVNWIEDNKILSRNVNDSSMNLVYRILELYSSKLLFI